jgi:hypothetical protein
LYKFEGGDTKHFLKLMSFGYRPFLEFAVFPDFPWDIMNPYMDDSLRIERCTGKLSIFYTRARGQFLSQIVHFF